MPNLDKLREEISEAHAATPQRQWHALAAFDSLKASLATLATFGYRFDLVEAEDAKPQACPAARYHPVHGFLAVASQEEADGLGEGWGDKPIVAGPRVAIVPAEGPLDPTKHVLQQPAATPTPAVTAEAVASPEPKTVDIAAFAAEHGGE